MLPKIEVPDGPPAIVDAYREAVARLEAEELEDETRRDADGYFSYDVLAERETRRVEFAISIASLERELVLFNEQQRKQILQAQLEELE